MRVGSGLDFGELARRLTNRHALFARRRLNIVVKPVDRLGHLLYLALQGLNLYFSLLAHHLTLISLAGVLRQELLLRNVPVSHSPAAPELGNERILGLPLRKEGAPWPCLCCPTAGCVQCRSSLPFLLRPQLPRPAQG